MLPAVTTVNEWAEHIYSNKPLRADDDTSRDNIVSHDIVKHSNQISNCRMQITDRKKPYGQAQHASWKWPCNCIIILLDPTKPYSQVRQKAWNEAVRIYWWRRSDFGRPSKLISYLSSLLFPACVDREISCDKWVSRLEACGWPENVRNSLHTACCVAQHIHQVSIQVACLLTIPCGGRPNWGRV